MTTFKSRGPDQRGAANSRAILTPEQVIAIYQSEEKLEYLAEIYNCSCHAISSIWTGRTWSHITEHLEQPQVKRAGRKRKQRQHPLT